MTATETSIRRSRSSNGILSKFAPSKGHLSLPVVLYFIVVMLPIGFSLGPIYMTGVRLLLIVMIIPLSVRLIAGKYGRVLLTDILFFLHFFWIVISLAVNNPDQVLQNAGSTGIEFIGGYALARAYVRNSDDFAALVRLMASIILLMLPFVIFETVSGNAVILNTLEKIPSINSLTDIEIGKRMGLFRTQVVFVHPIHWGLFCAIILPMCYIGLNGIYSNARRIAISLVIGICGLLALSSGALLAIILQLALFFWAWTFRKTDKRWMILLGLFAFCYVVVDILSNRSPLMVFLSYATFSAHTAYWRTIIFDWGMINVWANPIFGLGLNDWVRPSYMHSGSMDNFWLVMAVRYGIPGFLFIAAGYAIALWKIGRSKFDNDPVLWQFRRSWMFSIVGLTFAICTVHVWHTIYSFVFFAFGSGMWMLTVSPRNEAELLTSKTTTSRRQISMVRRRTDEATSSPPEATVQPSEGTYSPYSRFPVSK